MQITQTTASAKIGTNSASYPLTIGAAYLYNNGEQSRQYNGLLDDVALWGKALSKTEVVTVYSTEFQRSSSGSQCFVSQITPAPSTSAPPTPAPSTSAPPTPAPSTSAPPTPTSAPSTSAPPTSAPSTSAPPTPAPSTSAPPTPAPSTSAPPTPAPSTPPTPTPALSTLIPPITVFTPTPEATQAKSICPQNSNCVIDLSNTVINAPMTITQKCESINYICLAGSTGTITINSSNSTIVL